MFYDRFVELSVKSNKTPSAVALECGLSKPTVTRWKQGGNPTDATAQKIADYFGVSIEYLLTGEEQNIKKDPRYIVEGESIFEKRVGFSGETKKYLTEDDLDDIATIIRAKAERNRQRAARHDNTGKDT